MNDTPELEAIDSSNLGDIVYRRLCEALMRGRFPPGTRLTIRELAGLLGTSGTPVRDAILRLVQDEALVQTRGREVRVPVMSQRRYQEIRSIRTRLEGLAAREAALSATPEDVARLRDLIRRGEIAIGEERWHDAVELNQMFHGAFAGIAGMPVLSSILGRLWLQMGPLIADAYANGGRLMNHAHDRIVDAVAAREPDAAEAAMIRDINDASGLIVSRIDSLGGARA
ncbi:GntR family transcriptional regulator [Ensifer soli]|uniref:GntR family transcriptional regulator n=1 Tax=Ciceribacter sp. sgz301302 TaxID=3342379 RepID=UPI0035BB1648